ncbi:hypothetical protein RJ639_045560 [Escallonia herrerae]|uniref:Uncharacterized protein n=1 Tax=Escallonia herrerae TaxID=1293975 RepID=A0AA89B0Z4_9ASTE|nr:hypothetical protein RJ639_045560 [Escallonia herrerae]
MQYISQEEEEEEEEEEEMKLVWSPETALQAYVDTVKSCKLAKQSGEAECISAMAGGWNTKLIVEAWLHGGTITTSIGLAIAARHSGARHVCVVPDERSRLEYVNSMRTSGASVPEVLVGEAEEVMVGLVGVDFLVVDGRRKDFGRVVRVARLGESGAVLVRKNASFSNMAGFRWGKVLDNATHVVRSVVLPVGNGLDIAYVGKNCGVTSSPKRPKSWIRHIDQQSGEEHLFRG